MLIATWGLVKIQRFAADLHQSMVWGDQLQDPLSRQGEAGGEQFGGQGAHVPGVGCCQETKALQHGDLLQRCQATGREASMVTRI